MKFNTEEYAKIIECYFTNRKSATLAARAFNTWKRCNNIQCPNASRDDVRRTVHKLKHKGKTNACYKGNVGCLRSALNAYNSLLVFAHMTEPAEDETLT